ncbi:MAG: tRNA (adenosine(37)-N6)-dimethylallyltransferase MiaA [Thermoleophilia bacterium]
MGHLVIALFGPTASGKTAVAEALAERIRAELISADSMQVYRGLPILTNQPSKPTRLVAIWPLHKEASVGEYQRLAHAAIDHALAQRRTPIVVGGTGLYLRAALAELQVPPAPSPEARARWERLYDRLGPERAHCLLAGRDPQAASRVHPRDRRRVVRALELAEMGYSLRPRNDRLWSAEARHPTLLVGLDVPREELERRIRARTEAMLAAGAAEEARRALQGRLSTTARQAIGLLELARLPAREAAEAIVLRTRQYASYQRKWMRRLPGLATVDGTRPPHEIADEILDLARRRQRLPAHRGARAGA